MFCTNCGCKLDDDAVFCEQCGTKVLEEQTQEQPPEVTEVPTVVDAVPGKGREVWEKVRHFVTENKKKVGIAAGAAVLVLAIVLFFVLRPVTVNLNKYVSVEYQGVNSYGTAKVSFDKEAFCKDYADKIEYVGEDKAFYFFGGSSPCEILLDMDVDGRLDVKKGLSNGDTIVYTWDCDDEDVKKNFGVRLSYKDITFTVEGLSEPKEVDPFADIELKYSGTASNARAAVQNDASSYNLSFEISPNKNLNNGDTITVSVVNGDSDALKERLLEQYGVTLTQTSKTYKVEGLPSYVKSLDMISDSSMEQLDQQSSDLLKNKVVKGWGEAYTLKDASCVGNYLLFSKKESSILSKNILYFVYKVDVTITNPEQQVEETVSIYCPVGYYDVTAAPDGTVDVDAEQYITPYGSIAKEVGDKQYFLSGYESLEAFVEKCITANDAQYTCESTVETK